MLAIHSKWIEMIFNEEKGLEFRNKIISTIKPETKIFFYETKKENGIGKVVGEAIITNVEKIDPSKKEFYYQCFNGIGYSNQNYVIRFAAVEKYETPLDLSKFSYDNGKIVKQAPQNMINVRRNFL